MPDTPTAAMEAALAALPCLCEMPVAGQHTTPCPKVYAYEIACAMDAYAAERITEYFKGWQEERNAALAKLGAAEACTTCDGQPHVSGSICICGDSGQRSDETMNLRQLAQATQGQLDAAVEHAREQESLATQAGIDCETQYQRALRAEERVRVLEVSIDLALRFMPQHEPHTKILRESRNAKAAADPHPFDYDNEEANDAR